MSGGDNLMYMHPALAKPECKPTEGMDYLDRMVLPPGRHALRTLCSISSVASFVGNGTCQRPT